MSCGARSFGRAACSTTCSSQRRCRRAHAGVARQPRRRALQPVLRHLVEVLRVPHGAPARRAAADPQRAHRGGSRSTAPRRGRRSATSRCPSSGRRSGCRSSCRSSAPSNSSTSSGSPPRADRSAPRRRWPPTSSTSSDEASSATRAPCRSSSSGSRSSSRSSTSGSRCAATSGGLVSLAERDAVRAPTPTGSGVAPGGRSSTSSRSWCSASSCPAPVRVLGGFRDNAQLVDRSGRPARPVGDDELHATSCRSDDVLAPGGTAR